MRGAKNVKICRKRRENVKKPLRQAGPGKENTHEAETRGVCRPACRLRPAGSGIGKNPASVLATDSPGQPGLYRRYGECPFCAPIDKNGKALPSNRVGEGKTHMELNMEETCAILRAQMREETPDVVRTLCVTDALGNQMTPWFLLQDGVSRKTARKLLEEKLSLLGEPVQEVENLKNGILTVAETSVRLRALGMKVSPTTLRLGLQQRVFPFGDCVKTGEDNTLCFVYEKLLDQWIQARFNPDEAEEAVVLPEKSGVAINALPASSTAS